MKIQAIQKLTLLDFPGKTAATVFTYGCNLRCPFCHNSSLVVDKSEGFIDENEVYDLLEKRRGLLDGICITGGEPLLQSDIIDFIKHVREMGFMVKLDTNGAFPDRLAPILAEKLVNYVAMDVKNSPERYFAAVGIPGIDVSPFSRSIELIKSSGVDHEFRTTLVNGIHTKDDMVSIAKWIGPDSKYFIQMFVDSGDVLANRSSESSLDAFSKSEAEDILASVLEYNGNAKLRGV